MSALPWFVRPAQTLRPMATFVTKSNGTELVASVAGVEHMGTGGSNFSFSFGECQAPQD